MSLTSTGGASIPAKTLRTRSTRTPARARVLVVAEPVRVRAAGLGEVERDALDHCGEREDRQGSPRSRSANLTTWAPPTSTAAAMASTRSAIGPPPSSTTSVSRPSTATLGRVRHRGGNRCRNLARRRAVPRCAACTARHRTSESGPVALPSPEPRAMSIRGCLLLRYGGGARQGCDRPPNGRHPQRLSAGDPEPEGRRGRHPRGDRIPAGNDPCAIRHVLRWRAPRRVSHPCDDLSRPSMR